MGAIYDPKHPDYYDEPDLRAELSRVYDLCHGCRLCFKFCTSFPTLFDAVDALDGDVEGLTVAQQDQVVDECFQCKMCFVKCPYIPPHEWNLDFPRLMLRAKAIEHKNKPITKVSLPKFMMGATDLVGKAGVATSAAANKVLTKPGSKSRKVMQMVTGVHAQRILPPYAKQRFSKWFRRFRRDNPAPLDARETATVFPTCLVEYQNTSVGQDLVRVLEHNDVACEVPNGLGCCGMPWLDNGDVDRFVKAASKNLPVLAEAARKGQKIVVSQPTCGYVLKKEYVEYVGGDDAAIVAANTVDASEFLNQKAKSGELKTDFVDGVPEEVVWHVPCHLQAQNVGFNTRDVLKLTGTQVTPVTRCAGIDGTWGLQAENYELARKVARPLVRDLDKVPDAVVVGECSLANGAIEQETGRVPQHPLEFLSRAYGLRVDEGAEKP